MCTPATCRTCGKTTWSGCGRHVDQVMRSIPPTKRCSCDPSERRPTGLLARLFGSRR